MEEQKSLTGRGELAPVPEPGLSEAQLVEFIRIAPIGLKRPRAGAPSKWSRSLIQPATSRKPLKS